MTNEELTKRLDNIQVMAEKLVQLQGDLTRALHVGRGADTATYHDILRMIEYGAADLQKFAAIAQWSEGWEAAFRYTQEDLAK